MPLNDLILLFPTVLHHLKPSLDFEDVKGDMLKYVYKQRRIDPKGVVLSNHGGWQSDNIFHRNSDNNTDPFIPYILKEINTYLVDNKVFKDGVHIEILNAWININRKGDLNLGHVHCDSDWSGVFYLKVPKNSGSLQFECPNYFNSYRELLCYTQEFADHTNAYGEAWRTCNDGDIILFPSSVYHKVASSESRKDRISVAFNMALRYPR